MYQTIEPFAARLRASLESSGDSDYWEEVWSAIASFHIYATGENYCFEVRTFDELPAPSSKLYALPLEFEGRWDSIALAQSALEGMGGDESLADFQGTVLAGRIEIVRSRLFCIAHHIYWAHIEPSPSDYAVRVAQWLQQIGGDRLHYADDAYYLPLIEPANTVPQGSARWLEDWLRFRYDNRNSPVSIIARVRGDEFDPDAPTIPVDRSIVLAAAAFAWNDYSLVNDIGDRRAVQLVTAAGMALFLALQSAEDDDQERKEQVDWSREGGLERHRHTRALKEWALAEAARLPGSDRELARTLAGRLPERFVGVSEDPIRLIYDAIRAKRGEALGRERSRRRQLDTGNTAA